MSDQPPVGAWLSGSGPESDIVMSSRIRLARNVADYRFLSLIEAPDRDRLATYLEGYLGSLDFGEPLHYAELDELDEIGSGCLVERHLVSRDLVQSTGRRGVAYSKDEQLSIMVNEEDHLRVQVLRSGLQLTEAFGKARDVDDRLEEKVSFAFSQRFGYLTACPTNVGTGLRVSVMLHLPALVLSKAIQKVCKAMSRINLTVRGLHGEGSQSLGDFFQVSNQMTLGRSEREILRQVEEHVPQIIRHERSLRERLIERNRVAIEDRVWRAYGLLTQARLINGEETLECLSALRMGLHMELIDGLDTALLNELFVLTQPAHLQRRAGRPLESEERDELRAQLVRERLARKGEAG